jgi:hypothetical protein
MAQDFDTSHPSTIDRGHRLGRLGSFGALERTESPHEAARWPATGPHLVSDADDPGLVWLAGLPVERASAELTMRDLLTTWRSAERRLEAATEGSVDWSLVRVQIAGLRAAYQRLFAQIRRELPGR